MRQTADDSRSSRNLIHLADTAAGITRLRRDGRFRYVDAQGRTLKDNAAQARIRALAIPPAWTDVWISPRPNSHLQATGRDARGRKQYRYHPAFRAHQEQEKFEHLIDFAKALPAIRRTVRKHMARKGLPREKVLATVVHLLETTLIRVGNADYARANQSYGLTTLRDPHVDVNGAALRFHFKGKSGRVWKLKVSNRRVAKIVKACQDLPGQHLFQYMNGDGTLHDVTSGDVNAYLREITHRDITAKDFRTWAGTVLAALALREFAAIDSEAAAKRNVRAAIESVAAHLGNTATICRKCYIHPAILETYMAGELALTIKQRAAADLRATLHRLKPEEAAVLAVLQATLKRKTRKKLAKA
jgi:DNA topoisomerase-1